MQNEDVKVFFSYARADSEFVLRLAGDMRSAGVNLWIDQLDIATGARWDQAVEDALKACQRLLIVLSPTSIASQNVMDEVAFAIDQNKQIIPVLYRNCDIPFRLKRLQHIDFTGEYDEALSKLLIALNTYSIPPRNVIKTPHTKPRFLRVIANKRISIMLVIIALFGILGWALMANLDNVFSLSINAREWMTSQQYQEAYTKQVKEGFYPHKLEVKCKNNSEQLHAEWKAFPLGSEGFLHIYGVTREIYESKNKEYMAMGFTLESLNNFKDCAGDDYYEANWFKRRPVTLVK